MIKTIVHLSCVLGTFFLVSQGVVFFCSLHRAPLPSTVSHLSLMAGLSFFGISFIYLKMFVHLLTGTSIDISKLRFVWILIVFMQSFSLEMPKSNFSVELDAANATWLSNDIALFSVKTGELLLLTLVNNGRHDSFSFFRPHSVLFNC